jgi:hypothetical protein
MLDSVVHGLGLNSTKDAGVCITFNVEVRLAYLALAFSRRSKASGHPEGRRDYCFDLDAREDCNDEDESGEDRYTVDAYAAGLSALHPKQLRCSEFSNPL